MSVHGLADFIGYGVLGLLAFLVVGGILTAILDAIEDAFYRIKWALRREGR